MNECIGALQAFPSHFILEGMETLSVPKMRCMKERILEGIQSDLEPDCHEMARDRNLLLFLDYKLSDPCESYSVIEEIKGTTKDYPMDMIALANLAWIYVETNDCEEADLCVEHLKTLSMWSQVYADAELAYTYTRMGPKFCLNGSVLFENVIDFRTRYPGIDLEKAPLCLDKLNVIWRYGIILANQRILSPVGFGDFENFNCGMNGHPEKIIQRSSELLKTVASSKFGYYVAHAWLIFRKTYLSYISIHPKSCRKKKIDRLLDGYTSEDCLINAIKATRTLSNGDCHALLLIGTAYRKWPIKDLETSEPFLREALRGLDKNPVVYHQLALLCMDKWQKASSDVPNKCTLYQRDPGNPLLAEAIGYLQKALELNQKVSVLFLTDLLRCKFSYAAEPFTKEEVKDIMATMDQLHLNIRRYVETSKSDKAYALFHVGLIHEAFGNLTKTHNFLKQSVQMAVDCGIRADAFPKLKSLVEKDCSENPGVEKYKIQAELYEMVQHHQKAIQSYEKIRELGDESPAVLEKHADNLCREGQYMDARQCLKLLLSQGSDQFQTGESRSQFIDVCLWAARQYMDDNERAAAANIYQELITDMMPRDVPAAYSKVVVLSSEHKHDHTKTESLIKLLREDLGFNEDSCKWPYENTDGYHEQYNDFIFGYIKKTWCCVVHLTDVLLQGGDFMKTILRQSADFLTCQPFRGQLVFIDDLSDSEAEENQAILEPFHCFPKLKYTNLFEDGIDTASTCEQIIKGLFGYQDQFLYYDLENVHL